MNQHFHFLKAFLIAHVDATQVLLFTAIITLLWLAEELIIGEPVATKWRHTSTNILLTLAALPIQLSAGLILIKSSSWITVNHWGLIYYLPNASSPWIKYALMLLVLDFLDYTYHYIAHCIPVFWRFHLVHHTDRKVDVSSTLREHPGETLLRNIWLIVWVFILGASFGVLVIRQTLQTASNIFSHTSIRMPRMVSLVLGWVFMTPDLHCTHHHYKLPYTDRNYGDILSIWDRIFGTFALLSVHDRVYGLDTHMHDGIKGNYISLLAMPFRKRRRVHVNNQPIFYPALLVVLVFLGILCTSSPAQAQLHKHDFTYKIVHPTYGNIGTFTESIEKKPDTTNIRIHVNIAVSILGITVYHEEGDRSEIFRGDRFVALRSSTVTNGERFEVRGDSDGEHFVITAPTGVTNAAANVFPSDPWMVKTRGVGTSVAIETGDILTTHVSGGEAALISIQDSTIVTRHFIASGENQQYDVWLNDHNVPVMFRSMEDGTPIDFILTTPISTAADTEDHLVPAAKLRPENNKAISGNF